MNSGDTFKELKDVLREFRDNRNWKKFHNPKDLAISISIEASELLEIFQWKNSREVKDVSKEKIDEIKDELADIMIYCLFLSEILDIDMGEIVLDKIGRNEDRYPVDRFKG